MTIQDIIKKKKDGKKITMLTAYDYPSALLVDKAGIDMVLVGDSVANVVMGLESTTEVSIDEMIHHAKAARKGAPDAFLIGDMPYKSLQKNIPEALKDAKRFIDEAGCDAVKLEWFDKCLDLTEEIVKAGIPVMNHIGLTPQTAKQLGGFKVQGKDAESARKLMEQAKQLEEKGCFSIVLECVPDKIAKMVTKSIAIPTIGIGAGAYCDGQVLVLHDIIGLFDKHRPKFVKQYVDCSELILSGLKKYKEEVEKGLFPSQEQSYSIKPEEIEKLK